MFSRILREQGIAPYAGSLALVEALRERGIPLAVVSSSKNAEEVLTAAGIRELFTAVMDGVIAERDGLASKPAPDASKAHGCSGSIRPALPRSKTPSRASSPRRRAGSRSSCLLYTSDAADE